MEAFKIERATARAEVIEKLRNIFKHHIGIANAISSENLYFQVTGAKPGDSDYYEREYKWNSIKRVLGFLRKEEILFVVMGSSYHYVLDSKEELESYRNKTDATIKGLKAMKKKARNWVDSKELEELKEEAEAEPQEEEEPLKTISR